MRDAFGGVFMMRLLLVFIVIYVSFTAISYNYARAFRVKNKVIDYIEKKEIISETSVCTEGFKNMLEKAGYHKTCKNGNVEIISKEGFVEGVCCNGIVIAKDNENSKDKQIYYDIYTYADWNLGIINTILALGGESSNNRGLVEGTWEINGTARIHLR